MKDLTGQRFGRLLAVKPEEERKNGYVMWECQCDCGNTASVRSGRLLAGSTLSCGCLHKERLSKKAVDISGQRFGKLVALRPTEERRRGIVLWECQCDCGNMVSVLKTGLMKGETKSCGCLRRESATRDHARNLAGQRFGRLVALRSMEERKYGYVVWECKCDCGNVTYVPTALLTCGNTSSCGCLKKIDAGGTRAKDLTGQRFGKLVALRPTEERENRLVMWECLCDCGRTILVRSNRLKEGVIASCGCAHKQKAHE